MITLLNQDLNTIISQMESLDHHEIILKETSRVSEFSYHLLSREEFFTGQIGYRIDLEGNPLTGMKEGEWKDNWVVIGYEEGEGDPLFIDLSNEVHPVLTTKHDHGCWKPNILFSSFNDFIEKIS
jgi:hypothetical protein